MKMKAYAIYDSAAQVYMRPFYIQQDAQAERMFTDIATDANHEIGKHPEDYALIRLGTWDDNKGELESTQKTTIVTAIEAISRSRNVNPDQMNALEADIGQAQGTQ